MQMSLFSFGPFTREHTSCQNVLVIACGGGQGGGNPGEWGREVSGKREETERDAGVM